MSEFKPIETQEQLDQIITERINRAKDSVKKEYEGWISPSDLESKTKEYEDKIKSLNDTIADGNTKLNTANTSLEEMKNKLAKYENDSVKTRIANELGLSMDAVAFLQGDDEEAIRKSAELFIKAAGPKHPAPLGNYETSGEDDKKEAYKKMLKNIKGE